MKQLRFYLVYLVLGLCALFVFFHEDINVPVAQPLTAIPLSLSGWQKVGDTHFSTAVLENLRPTEYLYRTYAGSGQRQVSLYLGYHGGGPQSGPIHSPKHCLPGSGWQNVSEVIKTIRVGTEDISVVESIYENDGQRELFLYWFQAKGELYTNDYALRWAVITNSILYNRRDSAFIRISIPCRTGDSETAVLGEQFIRDFYPHIEAVLPK